MTSSLPGELSTFIRKGRVVITSSSKFKLPFDVFEILNSRPNKENISFVVSPRKTSPCKPGLENSRSALNECKSDENFPLRGFNVRLSLWNPSYLHVCQIQNMRLCLHVVASVFGLSSGSYLLVSRNISRFISLLNLQSEAL